MAANARRMLEEGRRVFRFDAVVGVKGTFDGEKRDLVEYLKSL